MAAPASGALDLRRIRTFFSRLPLATRGLLLALIGFYIAHLAWPGLTSWGALIPQQINVHTLYRLNTYPLIHKDFFHFILNTVALVPLLERFEADNGTIVTVIMFTGPFGLLPGGIYTLLERYVFNLNGAAIGASVWVFLLLAVEAIKMYRQDPRFAILDYEIPTWTTPLVLICVISFLVPHTSFLGHLCGAGVGYLWGLGYIRLLAPPDKILKFIEGKLNLLGRLPGYVSVDQKVYGRYGVLPSTTTVRAGNLSTANGIAVGSGGSGQRLGP